MHVFVQEKREIHCVEIILKSVISNEILHHKAAKAAQFEKSSSLQCSHCYTRLGFPRVAQPSPKWHARTHLYLAMQIADLSETEDFSQG